MANITTETESDHDQEYRESKTMIRSIERCRPRSEVQRESNHDQEYREMQTKIRSTERVKPQSV